MMEIQPVGFRTERDEYKCILITAISILGLHHDCKEVAARVANDVRSLGAADGVIESEMDHGLAIPVIIGQGCHARLFAMRLPSKSDRPVVEQVCFVSRTFE
jgi:hypothetical protein